MKNLFFLCLLFLFSCDSSNINEAFTTSKEKENTPTVSSKHKEPMMKKIPSCSQYYKFSHRQARPKARTRLI